MKAVIELDVPDWQIGEDVTVFFPDTMMKHGKCELLKEQEAVTIKKTKEHGFGVYGGICPKCNNWIQSAHSFCGFCGQPIAWENFDKKRIPHSPDSHVQWT